VEVNVLGDLTNTLYLFHKSCVGTRRLSHDVGELSST
jgi:hypothetical protein